MPHKRIVMFINLLCKQLNCLTYTLELHTLCCLHSSLFCCFHFVTLLQLELNQHLLAIVCGTLEVWKGEVHEDKILTPLQTQIDSLLQSV